MYIRKTKRIYKGKTYTNHLLVESVLTPKGPRQRTVCSLGRLGPAAREEWFALAHKMEAALQGQLSLQGQGVETKTLVERAGKGRKKAQRSGGTPGKVRSLQLIQTGSKPSNTVRPGQCTWGISYGDSWA